MSLIFVILSHFHQHFVISQYSQLFYITIIMRIYIMIITIVLIVASLPWNHPFSINRNKIQRNKKPTSRLQQPIKLQAYFIYDLPQFGNYLTENISLIINFKVKYFRGYTTSFTLNVYQSKNSCYRYIIVIYYIATYHCS